MTCPNYNSKEWRDLLKEEGGNEAAALKTWTKRYGTEETGEANKEIGSDDYREEGEGFQTEEEENADAFSSVINKLKTHIANKIDYLKRTEMTLKTEKIKELETLLALMGTLDELDSINAFVKYSYDQALQAEDYMQKTLDGKGTFTNKEMIDRITALLDYANNYNILDEIEQSDINEYFSNPVKGITERPEGDITAQEMLAYALQTRAKVKSKVQNVGIPLMAKFLHGYMPENVEERLQVEIDAIQKRMDNVNASSKLSDKRKKEKIEEFEARILSFQNFSPSEASLIKLLKEASNNEGLIDYLLMPLISSPDSALALFGRAVKTELEEAREKDIIVRRELAKALTAYEKSAPGSKDNPAKFNQGIYEILSLPRLNPDGSIERDVNGEPIYIETASFVQKYDLTAFKNSEKAFWKKLGPKPITPNDLRAYNKQISDWYKENKKPISKEERDIVFADKKSELRRKFITEEEYKKWEESVVYENEDGTVSYRKELSEPANKYISRGWAEMYDSNDVPKNPKGVYNKALTDVYFRQQELLPETQRPGYRLPSVLKSTGERMIINALKAGKTEIKEAFNVTANDYEYLSSSLSGDQALKTIQIKYNQSMEADQVSLNLVRSVLLFTESTNNFEALSRIHSETKLFKSLLSNRKMPKTNSKGNPILDSVASKLGFKEFIKENGIDYSKLHVDAFIDMQIYGELRKKEELFGVNIGKVADSVMTYSAYTSLALDLMKGVANNLQANIQVAIEAASSEFFGFKDYAVGKKMYTTSLGNFLSDFGKQVPESLVGMLIEKYDPVQGNFKDQYGKPVGASVLNKLFSTNTLFLNMHIGEHEIQVSTMFALMNRTKVIDNASGKEITLNEAYKLYGVDEIYNKTNFTKKGKLDLQNKLHALNKRLHGVYNSFDQATAQRYTLGRLALMYRKYLAPAYKRRFKKLGMDYELGSPTEGFYVTFYNTMIRDLRDYQFNIIKNWKTYTPFEKAQIRRVLAELGIVLALTALIYILKSVIPDDDDDPIKDTYMYNFILYQAIRMRSETKQNVPGVGLPDLWKTVKSPSAATTSVDRIIKFLGQAFVSIYDADARDYKRKTGPWEKGDSKTWAYFLKMMGYTGNNFYPDQAVKSFESIFNR